jgi:fructose-bisphosphate aldolase class II
MLQSAKSILVKAQAEGYAVGQFNIHNLEWMKTVLLVAEEQKSPVILGISAGAAKRMTGYRTVADMAKDMMESLDITVPVVLHLDHGTYDACKKCVEAGFSSVMFDGSSYEIEENRKKTKELIDLCQAKGISVEAEVGSIGGEEEGISGKGECADPEECRMIGDLGVSMLAAGIGNIHGQYPEDWQGLSFPTLKAIRNATGDLPLVLHGGTGIPESMIREAISLGVAKINVNTECQLAFAKGVRTYIEEKMDRIEKGYEMRKLMDSGMEELGNAVKEKMELFGSIGKA